LSHSVKYTSQAIVTEFSLCWFYVLNSMLGVKVRVWINHNSVPLTIKL